MSYPTTESDSNMESFKEVPKISTTRAAHTVYQNIWIQSDSESIFTPRKQQLILIELYLQFKYYDLFGFLILIVEKSSLSKSISRVSEVKQNALKEQSISDAILKSIIENKRKMNK